MNQLLFVVLLFLSEPAVSKAFKYEHANPNFCDINGLNPCKSKVSNRALFLSVLLLVSIP